MAVDPRPLDTHHAAIPARIKTYAALAAEARELEGEAMSTFGDRLAKARKAKHITHEQICELMNVSRQTVSLWERGKITPPNNPKRFQPLAKLLGTSIEWLLYGVDNTSGAAAADPRVEKVREVLHDFRRHYPALSEMLEAMAKAGLSGESLDNLRENIKGLRQAVRDLEDAVDG